MNIFRIIYDEYGQTGNRFISYIDSIGWAVVNNKRVVILFPEEILKYYDNFRNSPYIVLPLWGKGKLVWRIARKLFYYNCLVQKFYKTSLANKLGLYSGWNLSSSMDYYPKVKEEIVKIFTPNSNIVIPIDLTFEKFHKSTKTIIGVHFRKGDYKTYMGGAYFFEDDVFCNYMKQMKSLIPNSVFFIASNEPIPIYLYNEFDIIQNPVNNAPGDLYALSKCDYIMGPPSTFSGWASLIGGVPLFYLTKRKLHLSLSDFKPMRGGL